MVLAKLVDGRGVELNVSLQIGHLALVKVGLLSKPHVVFAGLLHIPLELENLRFFLLELLLKNLNFFGERSAVALKGTLIILLFFNSCSEHSVFVLDLSEAVFRFSQDLPHLFLLVITHFFANTCLNVIARLEVLDDAL